MKRFTYFPIQLVLLLFLGACSVEITEMQRISNPAAPVDAVVAIKETDATVATPTEVYVLPKGMKVSGDPVFRADNVEALRLVWNSESELTIHADKARVFLKLPGTKINVPGKAQELTVDIRLDIRDLR